MRNTTRMPLRVGRTTMVASANAVASVVGLDLLRRGGNAVDAAVGMGGSLTVIEPHSCLLGGEVFLQLCDDLYLRILDLNG